MLDIIIRRVVLFDYMQHASSTLTDTKTIAYELDELDRLLHRIRMRIATPKTQAAQLSHWREMRGILKGKITEDPLVYQRRIRAESERYPV